VHPALSLLLWAFAVLAVQLLSGWALAVLAAGLGIAALGLARQRTMRLVRRSRYLMLAIVVLFACFTPGRRLLAEPGWLPLTVEGVALAALHLGKLLCVITLVAILLERLARPELVLAIATLAAPLAWLGGDPGRLAVRLALVLDLVADRESTDWRHWLESPLPGSYPERIALAQRSMGWRDGVVLLVILLAMGLWQIVNA